MRELLDGGFAGPPDPTEAARRAMRPPLRRRFYQHARVKEEEGAFCLALDERVAKTPGGRILGSPKRSLTEALAAEWESQPDDIDPLRMPLTRLANSIIDGVAQSPSAVTAEVEKYLASDLVCYRAENPPGLVERQSAAWDPVMDWAWSSLGARFVLGAGIRHVNQPREALRAARTAIPADPWLLGAVHSITTLTGSALIALAVAQKALSPTQAWSAAHVDEDWNMGLWGRDELALEHRALRFAEFEAAVRVLQADNSLTSSSRCHRR
jgi:chaperone required for assembly of F1-ATPase